MKYLKSKHRNIPNNLRKKSNFIRKITNTEPKDYQHIPNFIQPNPNKNQSFSVQIRFYE